METTLAAACETLLGLAGGVLSRCLVLTDATQPDNPIVFVNPSFTTLTGYTPEEVLGRNCRFMRGPGTDPATIADIRQAVSAGQAIQRQILNYRRDGTPFWSDLTIDPIRDSGGQLLGFAGTHYEMSGIDHAQPGLAEVQRQLTTIIGNVPGYVFQRVLRASGAIGYTYVSPSLFRMLGLPPDTDWSDGQALFHFMPEDREVFLQQAMQSAEVMTPMRLETRMIDASGNAHWFRTFSTPRRLPTGDVVWEGLALDITAERTARAELDFVTHHDMLTGLSNRFFFKTEFLKAAEAARRSASRVGVYYIDLCSFGDISDRWGEAFADKVLRRIALTLTELAETLSGRVSRLGGDEFGLLLPEMPDDATPDGIGMKICNEISRPMVIDGTGIVVEACVGVTEFVPADDTGPRSTEDLWAEIMRRVHLAVMEAKRDGAGACRLYSAGIDDRSRSRTALRLSLQQAIDDAQFEMHYQPIVDLASGAIVGAEALVRWPHPELGMVRPDMFIPIAESTRLIVPLGAWITRTVMQQAQAWRRRGLATPRISINLSSVQLQRPGFLEAVQQALAETGANARDFEFELTETVLVDVSPELLERLAGLKALGFGLAIDDFGTGNATFSYLRHFPVDKIKIDQSFVRHLVAGSSDASIVRAMTALGRSLDLQVVAEGIETTRQCDFLLEEGCRTGQGYLFSLPMQAEDFAWLLEQRVRLPIPGADLAGQEEGGDEHEHDAAHALA
jgi:diguanylate cyclase (GGDEF)-like protein/PAS domain S-box-containing protein